MLRSSTSNQGTRALRNCLAFGVLFVASACGGKATAVSPSRDGGKASDSGPGVDGGPAVDAGPAADAGPGVDGGPAVPAVDAGPAADAGPASDAGPAQCGPARLEYTAGQGGSGLNLPILSFPSEFAPCSSATECGCGLRCVADAALTATGLFFSPQGGGSGKQFCEQPCKSPGDCSDPSTVCRNGSCTLDFCAVGADGGPAAGTFGGTCSSANGRAGTCQIVYENDNYTAVFGVCVQGGTAVNGCKPGATRADPSEICKQGSLCLGGSYQACQPDAGGAPFCEQVCRLKQPGMCPAGTKCVAWAPESPQGMCFPSDLDFGLCQ